MWVPRTEAEIQAAIANGVVRESASFDAKLMLPPSGRNKDLAKDICAMTVDGGVLLYGLGGEDPTRPDDRQPFSLAGAAERVDLVAQTGISEPPTIEIVDISSHEQPRLGYLCVIVPASPRAPHMLTIDRDNRYWGRGQTGNRLLSEGEVARLYERREGWDSDRDQVLSETIAAYPFRFELETGVIVTTVRPVMPGRELLRAAAASTPIDEFLQDQLTGVGRGADIYPGQGTSGLGDALIVSRAGADRWIMCQDRNLEFPYQARVELSADGGLTYWHSPIISQTQEQRPIIMERSVTRAVYQALLTGAWMHERASFHGAVDLAVGVLGIERAFGATISHTIRPAPYGAADYRRHARVLTEELRSAPHSVVRRLLGDLFEVISTRDYDPFADRAR